MSWMDVTAGEKIAKARFMKWVTTSKGTQGVEVCFAFQEPATQKEEKLSWYGWLTGKTPESTKKNRERTMDTLIRVLGFNGNDSIDSSALFIDPNVLDFNREVKLVVEVEEWEGKLRPKIKWVNSMQGEDKFSECSPQEVSQVIKAAYLEAKERQSMKVPF